MSDLLGTALGVTNGISEGAGNASDTLVEAFKRSRQKPIADLNARKSTLESTQVFFNSFRSKLEALKNKAADFSDSTASLDNFQVKKAVSSDNTIATVAADTDAVIGLTTLKVNRLATNDILASDRLTAGDASGFTAGTKSFELIVNGETFNVNVEFDGTENNKAALGKIAAAINAVNDIGITAGAISDTSSTVRLTLTANATGTEGSITFNDIDSVLAPLGITNALYADPNNRTAFTASSAGFLLSDSATLDAAFEVNGIPISRSSNTVDDVVSGLTITLNKAQESDASAINISTSVNPDGVRSNINPLLNNFNAVLTVLSDNKNLFKTDFAIRSLQGDLRSIASSELGSGTLKYLSEVGIAFNPDGTLTVGDLERLEDAIDEDPEAVAQLFEAFSQQIETHLSGLLGNDGLINSRKTSISAQIKSITTRVESLQSRIDVQAEALRTQFLDLQRLYVEAQQQFSLISSFGQSFSSGR